MYHTITFDPAAAAPDVVIEMFGGMRIRYDVMLLDPQGNGHTLGDWHGNNWDGIKDEFSLGVQGPALPGLSGEKYRIVLTVRQAGDAIFSREYGQSISKPDVVTEDAVFVSSRHAVQGPGRPDHARLVSTIGREDFLVPTSPAFAVLGTQLRLAGPDFGQKAGGRDLAFFGDESGDTRSASGTLASGS